MKLRVEAVGDKCLVQRVDAVGDVERGPSCRFARKYRRGRSIDRAILTVMPSDATSANEPSIARTAAVSPCNTRERASSRLMPVKKFRDGSRRSTTRLTYDITSDPFGDLVIG